MKIVLNQNILKYANDSVYNKSGITSKGTAYKITKIVYLMAFVYTLLINSAVIIGQLLNISEYGAREQTDKIIAYLADAKTVLFSVVMITLLLIAAVVLISKKIAIAAAICNIISGTIGFMVFRNAMSASIESDGAKNFWLRHGAPIIALILLSVILMSILLNEKLKIKRGYNSICDMLYKEISSDGQVTDDEEFIKCMDEYDGHTLRANPDKPLKRSEKQRLKTEE
ncbi:MAG: hypothetical protein RR177_01480 [Oscillospiraceae bacterium]